MPCSVLLTCTQNTALLQGLGLDKPFFEPKVKPTPAKATSAQRKRKNKSEENEDSQPASKTQRSSEKSDVVTSGARRSARNVGKHIDYNSEIQKSVIKPLAKVPKSGNEGPLGRDGGKREHDPYEVCLEVVNLRTDIFVLIARFLATFLALRSAHGGKQDRAAARMPSTRKSFFA